MTRTADTVRVRVSAGGGPDASMCSGPRGSGQLGRPSPVGMRLHAPAHFRCAPSTQGPPRLQHRRKARQCGALTMEGCWHGMQARPVGRARRAAARQACPPPSPATEAVPRGCHVGTPPAAAISSAAPTCVGLAPTQCPLLVPAICHPPMVITFPLTPVACSSEAHSSAEPPLAVPVSMISWGLTAGECKWGGR